MLSESMNGQKAIKLKTSGGQITVKEAGAPSPGSGLKIGMALGPCPVPAPTISKELEFVSPFVRDL